MDTIKDGDKVSWIDPETGARIRGFVIGKYHGYYLVTPGWGQGGKALKPKELTKECE